MKFYLVPEIELTRVEKEAVIATSLSAMVDLDNFDGINFDDLK